MSAFSDAAGLAGVTDAPRAKHPPGWEPHVEERGDTASAVSDPIPGSPSHDDLIRGWDMDPVVWEIVGDVNVRRWQRHDGEWLRYFRANLRRRRAAGDPADVEALCRAALRKPPAHRPVATDTGRALVVALNDWQIGKNEGPGRGTVEAVERITRQIWMLPALIRLHKPSSVVLAGVGDITERVAGHYPSQNWTTDLDEREQQRVARRLLLAAVNAVAPLVESVTMTAVPCNHGETRNAAGKMMTRVSDSVSLTLAENVAEVCAANPERYGHVRFLYAADATLVHDVEGIQLATNHGHHFRGKGDAMRTAWEWWAGQVMGTQPVAAADVLLTAHKHHFQVSEERGRTVMLAPANDGGSAWWTRMTGQESPPGMLTFGLGLGYGSPAEGRCWDHLRVLA